MLRIDFQGGLQGRVSLGGLILAMEEGTGQTVGTA